MLSCCFLIHSASNKLKKSPIAQYLQLLLYFWMNIVICGCFSDKYSSKA